MSRISVVASGLVLATGVALAGCSAVAAAGGTQRNFPVSAFDQITVAGSADVSVATGKTVSVRATGDAAAIDRLEITVANNRLTIGNKRGGWNWKSGKVHIYVTVPALRGAAVAGSADVEVDRVQADDFSAAVTGSGSVRIASLAARSARFSIAGSGDATATGTVQALSVNVAGSGNASLAALKTTSLTAAVKGSGDLDAYATGDAALSVAGSGDIRVTGGARCTTSKAGSGTIRCV